MLENRIELQQSEIIFDEDKFVFARTEIEFRMNEFVFEEDNFGRAQN